MSETPPSQESLLITDPEEIKRIYESARPSDGVWNKPGINVKALDGFHLVDHSGKRFLDLHAQILCYVLGNGNTRERVADVKKEVGMTTFGPDFTHPALDMAQAKLAKLFADAGWGDYNVSFHSSGTRANEDGLRMGRAVLGGRMHLMLLRECYHGNGLLSSLVGHAPWKANSTLPLGVPMSFLDHRPDAPFFRDHRESFHRAMACDAASDSRPYFLAEPIQGVAGFRVPNPAAFQEITREVHNRKGAVHYDCVQTMPFRTGGDIFAQEGLVDPKDPLTIPDIVTSAKGCGDGEVFAFLAVRKKFLKQAAAGAFARGYDTHGRNLGGAVAFNNVHDTVTAPGFAEDLNNNAERFRDGLFDLQSRYTDKVRGVTGMGMMTGLELDSKQRVAAFRKAGIDQAVPATNGKKEEIGLVTGAGGIEENVLRFGMRLDAPREIVDKALEKIEACLKAA